MHSGKTVAGCAKGDRAVGSTRARLDEFYEYHRSDQLASAKELNSMSKSIAIIVVPEKSFAESVP
jgi:hypothetical protein